MHLVFMAICLTAKAICAQDCMCKMFVEWQLFLCRRDMYFLCSHQIREVKSGWGGLRTLWYTRKHKLTTLDYWVPITTTCQFDGPWKDNMEIGTLWHLHKDEMKFHNKMWCFQLLSHLLWTVCCLISGSQGSPAIPIHIWLWILGPSIERCERFPL
jgi:hypothetical protein